MLTIALVTVLTGCGAEPETIDPSGVDTLTVPTPSPDPGDFVEEVDSPWWPLSPGARWEYELVTPDGTGRRVVTVEESDEVAGVPATAVRTVTEVAGEREASVRRYAQDRSGHVWLVAEDDRWRTGPDVPAGLWVPAEPRLGDGYVLVDLSGTPQASGAGDASWVTVRVRETGAEVSVPAGEYDEVVRLEVHAGADDGTSDASATSGQGEHVHLAPGVGEVLRIADSGRVQARLVSFSDGS